MKITKKKTYTHLNPDNDSFELFFNEFNNNFEDFKNDHLLVDFSKFFNIQLEDLFVFLSISENHRSNKLSFVIVANGIDFDELPDELVVAPTLTEAKDILEMEAIERDLGF